MNEFVTQFFMYFMAGAGLLFGMILVAWIGYKLGITDRPTIGKPERPDDGKDTSVPSELN